MPRRKTVDYGPHNNASAADTTDIVELDDAGETAANDNEIVDSIEVATNNENELNYGAQVATNISQLADAGETAAFDDFSTIDQRPLSIIDHDTCDPLHTNVIQ